MPAIVTTAAIETDALRLQDLGCGTTFQLI